MPRPLTGLVRRGVRQRVSHFDFSGNLYVTGQKRLKNDSRDIGADATLPGAAPFIYRR